MTFYKSEDLIFGLQVIFILQVFQSDNKVCHRWPLCPASFTIAPAGVETYSRKYKAAIAGELLPRTVHVPLCS